jgi:lipoyl(octanoyl) transferase
MPRMRWYMHHSPPLDAVDNMAWDEALLQRARQQREFVLRVYTWAAPTLSLGRHQRALGVFSAESAQRAGVSLVRRLTGGRAVLHHREITYSVTGPALAGDSLRRSYATINAVLLDALRRLGVPAALAPEMPRGSRVPLPSSAPCFELPFPGEIVLGPRKLVGSAQVREDGAFLQHGSILIEDDQPRIAGLARAALPPSAPAATLRDALGRAPSSGEVAEALFTAVRTCVDTRASALPLDASLEDAARRAGERYRDAAWTWRR